MENAKANTGVESPTLAKEILYVLVSSVAIITVVHPIAWGSQQSMGQQSVPPTYTFALTAFGAFVSHIFTKSNANRIVLDDLFAFTGIGATLKVWIKAVFIAVVGATLGVVIGEPQTPKQALIIGLGWTGLLSAYGSARDRVRRQDES